MSCAGPLSGLMSIAGAGMLPGAGALAGIGSSLGVSAALTSAIGSFAGQPAVSQLSGLVSAASGVLSGGTLSALQTLGSIALPGLTNAIPGGFASALGTILPGGALPGGLTGLIGQTAAGIMGGGDLGKFAQVFNSAQGFIGGSNSLLNSALNISNLSTTFGPLTGGMDSLITGGFSQVSEAFGQFGSDLGNLGSLINMNNLPNLGNPSALIGQLASVGGLVPGVETALRTAGLDSGAIAGLATGGFGNISDTANKLLYNGMTQITGADLAQVKNVLGVTTGGINSMADLLNPAKILPTSFTALTMPTPDGLRAVYATAGGAVNTNLERFLQDPNAPAYTGDDAIVRARLGLPPLQATV